MASMLRPVLLNNGCLMPRLGIGTYMMTGDTCQDIVNRAIKIGYRHIDTAQRYGNEQDIGLVLRDTEHSNACSREQLFITTKLSNYNMEPKYVQPSLEESLDKLKTKYVDMFLIHMPFALKHQSKNNQSNDTERQYADTDFRDTWRAMEQVVQQGLAKSIGLSNFSEKQISEILSIAKVVPQNVQMECHVYNQQTRLRSFLSSKNIAVSAYSPLGAKDRPARHITPENKYANLLEELMVKEIASNYGVSPAVVLLRYILQIDAVVLPKTSTLNRLEENYKVLDFQLDPTDCQKLKTLDRGVKYFVFPFYQAHPNFTKSNEPF